MTKCRRSLRGGFCSTSAATSSSGWLDGTAKSCGRGSTGARQRLADAGIAVPAVEARTRFAWVRSGCRCRSRQACNAARHLDRPLDRVLTHRVLGHADLPRRHVPDVPVDLPVGEAAHGPDRRRPRIGGARASSRRWPPGPLRALVADGVIKGVGSVLVFLPQILILFGVHRVLEDCGYMARAAFLMDRLMSRCGLSGKSFIPLLSSSRARCRASWRRA